MDAVAEDDGNGSACSLQPGHEGIREGRVREGYLLVGRGAVDPSQVDDGVDVSQRASQPVGIAHVVAPESDDVAAPPRPGQASHVPADEAVGTGHRDPRTVEGQVAHDALLSSNRWICGRVRNRSIVCSTSSRVVLWLV